MTGGGSWRGVFLALIAGLGLSACATLSEEECLTADWRTIGYEDGIEGYAPDRIGKHREACAKVGETPDLDLYMSGRDDGLEVYCRPARGFEVGAEGETYKGVCPEALEGDFLAAYDDGRRLYELEEDAEEIRDRIRELERDIDGYRDEIDRKRDRIDFGVPAAEEDRLRKDIRKRRRDIERAEDDIADATRDLGYAEGRIDEFRRSVWY